jgi:hypothetical protein
VTHRAYLEDIKRTTLERRARKIEQEESTYQKLTRRQEDSPNGHYDQPAKADQRVLSENDLTACQP